jgi:hypothetical protein
MTNNDIFLEFWNNFKWPEPEVLYFRLYHDDQGKPICYSRQVLEGQFIDVTPEQFAIGDINVDVINGVLVHHAPPPPPKLQPSDRGVMCHKDDVTVIVQHSELAIKWNLE